ncbi:hypothetical protein C7U60_02520 [Mesorhizobium plurifarium]|nr:hypothetical protein C7U60_02520 [Mesorhizobium plurifarium]
MLGLIGRHTGVQGRAAPAALPARAKVFDKVPKTCAIFRAGRGKREVLFARVPLWLLRTDCGASRISWRVLRLAASAGGPRILQQCTPS